MDLWFFFIPIVLATVGYIVALWKSLPRHVWPILYSAILIPVPIVLARYLNHHFMCFSSPEVYSEVFTSLSTVFIIAPVGFLWIKKMMERKSMKVNQS